MVFFFFLLRPLLLMDPRCSGVVDGTGRTYPRPLLEESSTLPRLVYLIINRWCSNTNPPSLFSQDESFIKKLDFPYITIKSRNIIYSYLFIYSLLVIDHSLDYIPWFLLFIFHCFSHEYSYRITRVVSVQYKINFNTVNETYGYPPVVNLFIYMYQHKSKQHKLTQI